MVHILYLDKSSLSVKITEQGKEIPEFKEFLKKDKSTNKRFFHASMAFIYWLYAKKTEYDDGSPYYDIPLIDRIDLALTHIPGKITKEQFVENPYIKKCINRYKELTTSPIERSIQQLIDELNSTHEYLKNIPRTKKQKANFYTTIEENGEVVSKNVEAFVDYDNTPEKLKSFKLINEVLALLDTYQARLKKERFEESGVDDEYMFDNKKEEFSPESFQNNEII